MSFEGLFILGALLFLAGFLTTVFYFVSMRRSAAPGRAPPSVLRYFGFAAIAAGVVLELYGPWWRRRVAR